MQAQRERRQIGIVADAEIGEKLAAQLAERFGDAEFAFVAPAVTRTHFEHLTGSADDAREEAEHRVEGSVPALEHAGVHADPAAVGDQDPVIAIEDLERELGDLDEVVLITHAGEEERWVEHDAFDRARRRLAVPISHLEVNAGGELVNRERSDPGADAAPDPQVRGWGRNIPSFSLREFLAIVVAIVGTIVLGVIAAHDISVANDPVDGSGLGFGGLVTVLLALGAFLINVWHIVGLTMFQSVGYRGAGSSFLARISLYGTLGAVVVALIIS